MRLSEFIPFVEMWFPVLPERMTCQFLNEWGEVEYTLRVDDDCYAYCPRRYMIIKHSNPKTYYIHEDSNGRPDYRIRNVSKDTVIKRITDSDIYANPEL